MRPLSRVLVVVLGILAIAGALVAFWRLAVGDFMTAAMIYSSVGLVGLALSFLARRIHRN